MKRKGQVQSIIYFVAVIIGLIFLAPILLKIISTTTTGLGDALVNHTEIGGGIAAQNAYYIRDKVISFWDGVIVSLFVLNIILLFVSAFLVDINPGFLVIYIIAVLFLFVFSPTVLNAASTIWDVFGSQSDNIPQYLVFTRFILDNFMPFLLGIIFVTGVLAYSRLGKNGGGR